MQLNDVAIFVLLSCILIIKIYNKCEVIFMFTALFKRFYHCPNRYECGLISGEKGNDFTMAKCIIPKSDSHMENTQKLSLSSSVLMYTNNCNI